MGYTFKQARALTTLTRWVGSPLRQGQTHGNVGAQSFGSLAGIRYPRVSDTGNGQPGCRTGRSGFYVMPILKTYAINYLNMRKESRLGERGNAFIEYFILALITLGAAIWFLDGGNFQGVRAEVETTFTGLIDQVAR